jgi:hypothetical protein
MPDGNVNAGGIRGAWRGGYLSQRLHLDRRHHRHLRTPDSNRAEGIMSIIGGGAVCIQATALNLGKAVWMQPAPDPYAQWKRQRERNPGEHGVEVV